MSRSASEGNGWNGTKIRIAELKRLFIRIYEDNACGRLSDERLDMLSLTYETEQKQLETECVTFATMES